MSQYVPFINTHQDLSLNLTEEESTLKDLQYYLELIRLKQQLQNSAII